MSKICFTAVLYSTFTEKQLTSLFPLVQSGLVQSLIMSDSVTPWIAARQASLSITNSWSSLRLTSTESVMPSSHLILCCPLLLLPPNPSQHQGLFQWVNSSHEVAKSIGVSTSASVLPMGTQDWSLAWTGWISLQSQGLSRVFSNTTFQKHQFFITQLSSQSNSHIHTWPLEKPLLLIISHKLGTKK